MRVSRVEDWPQAAPLQTERLALEPLRVEHADEMVTVLADPSLYGFTGGSAPTLEELTAAYHRRIEVGASDTEKRWCNWVVRDRATGAAVGAMQGEITALGGGALQGELSWIFGVEHQGRGYAREAAAAVAAWMRGVGEVRLIADIHPEHVASMRVARSLGLSQTDEVVHGGELRWTDRCA